MVLEPLVATVGTLAFRLACHVAYKLIFNIVVTCWSVFTRRIQVNEAPFRESLAFHVGSADIGGLALGLHPELYL